MKQLTSEQIDHVVEGFIGTLKEDQYLTLQETENGLLAYDVTLTLDQIKTISVFITDLIEKVDLVSWGYEYTRQGLNDLGDEIYMGFMYDSYDTILHDAEFDYSAEIFSYIEEGVTVAHVDGYFCIEGVMYHL